MLASMRVKFHSEPRLPDDTYNTGRVFNRAMRLLHGDVQVLCVVQQDDIVLPGYFAIAATLVRPKRVVCALKVFLDHSDISLEDVSSIYKAHGGVQTAPRIALLDNGERTLVELEDWRTFDGADFCVHWSDALPLDEKIRGYGHYFPDWALRHRLNGGRIYVTPLLQILHMKHGYPQVMGGRITEAEVSHEYMKKKWGPDIWHVDTAAHQLVLGRTAITAPLTTAHLRLLASGSISVLESNATSDTSG
jgi:hypothetical protein